MNAKFALLGLAILVCKASSASVTISSPLPSTSMVRLASCAGGAYRDCISTATFSTTPLAANNPVFKLEFDAWNAIRSPNGGYGEWSLRDGGALPGKRDGSASAFTVSTFQAEAFDQGGGLKIRIDWDYDGTNKADFFWVQGLRDNYVTDVSKPTLVDPYYKLDVDYNQKNSPPSYPFQYPDRYFYDRPSGPWPHGFFEASAFLAIVDFEQNTITAYEGISYGFRLSAAPVPEPGAGMLAIFGLFFVLSLKHVQQQTRR